MALGRFRNRLRPEDHARRRKKQHDHNQYGNNRPGKLDLVAPVNLRRLAVRIPGPMAEANQRIHQQAGDDEKDGKRNGKHQHGEIEDGMCRRGGRRKNTCGRLCHGCARNKKHATRSDTDSPASIKPADGMRSHPSRWEERQSRSASKSPSEDALMGASRLRIS